MNERETALQIEADLKPIRKKMQDAYVGRRLLFTFADGRTEERTVMRAYFIREEHDGDMSIQLMLDETVKSRRYFHPADPDLVWL